MESGFESRFEKALRSPDPHKRLAAFAKELRSQGRRPDEILEIFEAFQAQLRLVDRESDEDVVMDVMDRICGWCNPKAKLFPSN